MNWYKIAQTWESSGDLETDIEESQNKEELLRALKINSAKLDEEIVFPNKEVIWTAVIGNVLKIINISFPYPDLKDPNEWLWDIINGGNVWQYIDERDFSKEFWEGVGEGTTYYHGTEQENLDNILSKGLSPEDKTRGMTNKFTGAAVFLSDSYETATYSYDVVLEIDIGAMKKDGYMPLANLEEDIEESELINALAHKIGLDDFVYEVEQGMDPGTVVLKGNIPPQYIRVI
jgi:hypothetical protein